MYHLFKHVFGKNKKGLDEFFGSDVGITISEMSTNQLIDLRQSLKLVLDQTALIKYEFLYKARGTAINSKDPQVFEAALGLGLDFYENLGERISDEIKSRDKIDLVQ